MSKGKKIKCKFCDDIFFNIEDYVSHMEKNHADMIPPDMSPWQFVYFLKTGKSHGTCIMCKKDTTFNEKTHKYNRLCANPACKEKYVEQFRKNMIGKHGTTCLLNDPEQQKKMLAHRKISGEYKWSDHINSKTYTGTYELSFLEFIDTILNYDADDVMAPSPHTYYYVYEGKRHFYIPDFYIPSLNLEIEIKDSTNTHPKILAVDRVKEHLKDEVMKSNIRYINYIKIVEKDNTKLLKFLERAKYNFVNGYNINICMP